MNKDNFFTISPEKRVQEVNRLLQKNELKKVAEIVDVPYSTFTKIMREGDNFYHQSDRQYYPFIRPGSGRIVDGSNSQSDELDFIKENRDVLNRLIEMYQSNSLLILDESVYNKNAKYVNKSVKMNKEIYESYSQFCSDNYNHLKMQDLIAQALLDFMHKYKK